MSEWNDAIEAAAKVAHRAIECVIEAPGNVPPCHGHIVSAILGLVRDVPDEPGEDARVRAPTPPREEPRRDCGECWGRGYIVTCIDDLCHGNEECIHGDGYSPCRECGGSGDGGDDDDDLDYHEEATRRGWAALRHDQQGVGVSARRPRCERPHALATGRCGGTRRTGGEAAEREDDVMAKRKKCECCEGPLAKDDPIIGCEVCGRMVGPCCQSMKEGHCLDHDA